MLGKIRNNFQNQALAGKKIKILNQAQFLEYDRIILVELLENCHGMKKGQKISIDRYSIQRLVGKTK